MSDTFWGLLMLSIAVGYGAIVISTGLKHIGQELERRNGLLSTLGLHRRVQAISGGKK